MSEALIAIQQELRRLVQEGLDRVFVDEATLALLQAKPTQPRDEAPAVPEKTGVSRELEALLQASAPPEKKTPIATARAGTPPENNRLPEQPPEFELPDGDAAFRMRWLRERVENCPVCREHLGEGRKMVFGAGSLEADIFFCGDAPGTEEAQQGEPSVGAAGQLLTKIITAMGLTREEVYIADILKWQPGQNHTSGNPIPTAEALRFCLPYLKAQIQIVQPKVIVALGHTAVNGLLGPDPTRHMRAIRGTWQTFLGLPLLVTFHPAYLLPAESQANPNAKKRLVWEDMLQVMEKVGLPISEKQRGFFLTRKH